jgi:hypothetical protein
MRKNIIEIKAEQKLTRIIVADTTLKGINNAFNKLIKKLTIITDLFTPRRKPGINKGCPWWCSAVDDATARAKLWDNLVSKWVIRVKALGLS